MRFAEYGVVCHFCGSGFVFERLLSVFLKYILVVVKISACICNREKVVEQFII